MLFYPAGSTTATRVYGQMGSFTTGNGNQGGISANSLYGPDGIALDSNGNLYVADYGNNRVLYYPAGSTTATRVYGQGGSFTTNTTNNGGISANSLDLPAAVALDGNDNLYVADQYNNRVLFYPSGSTTATLVYGQVAASPPAARTTAGSAPTAYAFPTGVALDSSGNLYVADRQSVGSCSIPPAAPPPRASTGRRQLHYQHREQRRDQRQQLGESGWTRSR